MKTNEHTAPLPPDHPLRGELHEEVHARPSEALQAPLRLTFLALVSDASSRERGMAARARRWPRASASTVPAQDVNHLSADLGPFRLKWERHSEFARYKFIVPGRRGAAVRAACPRRAYPRTGSRRCPAP